jgi:molecular chaperone GrpE
MVKDEHKKENQEEKDAIVESNEEPLKLEPESTLKDKTNVESEIGSNEKLIEDYKDRLLRSQAEFQNYQKRMEREFADYKNYANSKLLGDLLFILDDFQNALAAACEERDKEYIKGFEMIYNNFREVLEKEGLSEIEAEDERFDPWKHEAVDMVPTTECPEHTILNVVQKGYKFKDKVIRPAMVRVSTQPKDVIDLKENEVEENDIDDKDKGGN